MGLRVVVLTACFVAVASYSFTEKRAYRECIEERLGEGNLLTKTDVRHCTDVAKLAADADRLALDYFVGLGDWKNGVDSLSNAILRTVAPCASRSSSIKTKWTNLYLARKDHEVAIIRANEQTWDQDVGTLSFSSEGVDLDLSKLEAAELLLQRSSPSDVGETFGRYHTLAYLHHLNGSVERIHVGVQTSCSSTRGELMVLDLDVQSLQEIMFDDPTAVVTLEVHVQARRQYLTGSSSSRRSRIAVVKQAIGLVLHTRHDPEQTSPHLLRAFSLKAGQIDLGEQVSSHNLFNSDDIQDDSEGRNMEGLLVRNRRGLNPPDRSSRSPATVVPGGRSLPCRRTSHRFDRQLYMVWAHCIGFVNSYCLINLFVKDMKIFKPQWHTEHFDIGLCEGRCSIPLAKTTNHAIAVANGAQGQDHICCTPTSYDDRPLHVTIYHPSEHPNPSQVRWDQLRARSCGCR